MKRVAIRLDAGKSIGSGHLMRCMSLAERLQSEYGIEVVFICRNELHIETGFETVCLGREYAAEEGGYYFPSICDELDDIKRVLHERQIDCLIVDHYGAGDDYFEEIRDSVSCLISIDDSTRRHIPVDMIINGNIYGKEADYGSVPVQLLGGEYTLLRSEFMDIPKRVLRTQLKIVYITSGGADPLHFCENIAQVVKTEMPDIELHIIVGSDFEPGYVDRLKGYKAVLHENADMKECMVEADLFISSAGSTLYELAVTGTPSISYILAEDQIKVAEKMWEENCSVEGGRYSEFRSQELADSIRRVSDFEIRKKMSDRGRKMIQSQGALNVVRQIAILLNIKRQGIR